ncbi:hypothetical protein ACIQUP_17435 [Streptomyces nigra]|uniref:hypothetical protein n=1 Tax=Streptomyces nigra TaxID=1827580 RepID=UPI00381F0A4B
MAGLNLRFTEEELDALRQRAAAEGRSVEAFAHDAVVAAVNERSRQFDEAADQVLRASAELNGKLA